VTLGGSIAAGGGVLDRSLLDGKTSDRGKRVQYDAGSMLAS
jgi:hypothetical protein